MTAPSLSIVVAVQGGEEETRRCLESLAQQQLSEKDRIEVIVEGSVAPQVVHEFQTRSSTTHSETTRDEIHTISALQNESLAAVVRIQQDKAVTFLDAQGPAASLPALHGRGMARSTGGLVAITEGHCTFAPDWAASHINAYDGPGAGAAHGGCVLPGGDLDPMNTALFLCDYIQFLPPLQEGISYDLPGNNISFQKQILPDSEALVRNGFWKTFFCHELEHKRVEIRINPALVVYYNRKLTLPQTISRRFHHGRCFGGMRSATIPLSTRLLLAAGGPALIYILFNKLYKRAARKTEGTKQVNQHFIWILLFLSAWAFGEWTGNIFGPGKSCDLL